MKLLSSEFPNCSIPATYEEAKRLIRALGLGYNSIHVCPNNCVLFRKELAEKDVCPVCGASRWKDNDGRMKIPEKVLRHFPLIPRLKRIFSSKKMSEEAQWHKLKRKPVENELSHPADGEAWKDFDRNYGWFAKDARNIRLGLATDGFNPFGKMSSSYSMWPVFLIPYNFPPWECVEQSNFIMGLLIPGRECPGKDIDVFLEPLIEELLELWKGVTTYPWSRMPRENEGCPDVQKTLEKHFSSWFKKHVGLLSIYLISINCFGFSQVGLPFFLGRLQDFVMWIKKT
jgi:hypothetical protein